MYDNVLEKQVDVRNLADVKVVVLVRVYKSLYHVLKTVNDALVRIKKLSFNCRNARHVV